jgi:hypothetical protein
MQVTSLSSESISKHCVSVSFNLVLHRRGAKLNKYNSVGFAIYAQGITAQKQIY